MNLISYGEKIENIFALQGTDENDITMAISFCLSTCQAFMDEFLVSIFGHGFRYSFPDTCVYFQNHYGDGITDIELCQPGLFHIIVEAKKNFIIPGKEQLTKYALALDKSKAMHKRIVVLSNADVEVARKQMKEQLCEAKTEMSYITYRDVVRFAEAALQRARYREKVFIRDLIYYIPEASNVKNKSSNVVYVVPLSGDSILEHDKDRQYHCPIGKGFPHEAPNYLGFRYGGCLQSINYVESVSHYIDNSGTPFFLFHLGPDIHPPKKVRTGGKMRGTKFYCYIDLLLTCDTIREANEKSKERDKID